MQGPEHELESEVVLRVSPTRTGQGAAAWPVERRPGGAAPGEPLSGTQICPPAGRPAATESAAQVQTARRCGGRSLRPGPPVKSRWSRAQAPGESADSERGSQATRRPDSDGLSSDLDAACGPGSGDHY